MIACSKCQVKTSPQVTMYARPNVCLCAKCSDDPVGAAAQLQGATRKMDGFCAICGEEGIEALVQDPRMDPAGNLGKAKSWRTCKQCLLRLVSRSMKPDEVTAMRRRAQSDTMLLRGYDARGRRPKQAQA